MLSQQAFASTKSQHRLETVSLSQALSHAPARLSTGLQTLDEALAGGIVRSQLFEVYGCPGSGKTTFGMHVAARAVAQGQKVTWLECSQALPASRLRDFLHDEESDERQTEIDEQMKLVQCVSTPTMTSLLALLTSYGPDSDDKTFISDETSLLVLDDLTTLYSAAFPPDNHKETSFKKAKILSTLADLLTRLAATRHIGVIVLAKLTSRIIKGSPAQLESPFGDAWAARCAARIVLYRDFPPRRLTQDSDDVRWLAVQKVSNRSILDPPGLPFRIVGSGIVGVDLEASQASRSRSQTPRIALKEPSTQSSSGPSRLRSSPDAPVPEKASKRARRSDEHADEESDDTVKEVDESVYDSQEE